jgi:hypothetical protein
MGTVIQGNPWVWVVVLDPGKNEQFLGQHDQEDDISFIPVFLNKEEALQALNRLALGQGRRSEVQAIQYEELARSSAEHGFMLFILNAKGEILEKIKP